MRQRIYHHSVSSHSVQRISSSAEVFDATQTGTLDYHGAMGVYLREIFFHIPSLIANYFNSQADYESAQRWYQRIFDPFASETITVNPALPAEEQRRRKLDRNWLGTPKRLTFDKRGFDPTAWTPDNRAVIFVSDREGPRKIFKQNIDQTQPEVMVDGDDTLSGMRLNPDATDLLYLIMPKADSPSQNVRIMRMPLAGGTSELVLEAPRILNQQCARVPSTLCIYSPEEPNQVRFFTFDPVTGSGSELAAARIKDSGGWHNWSLSPDGKLLASARGGGGLAGVAELRIFSIVNSSARTIVIPHWAGIAGVDWAAEGRSVWIGVISGDAPGFRKYFAQAVLRVDLNGKVIDRLESDSVRFDVAVPSPDGKKIALSGWTSD